MNITTKLVDDHTVEFWWDGSIKYAGVSPIHVHYPVDVSRTPKHILNFMFGMLAIEALCWTNAPVEFEELTKEELLCLLAFARSFHAGNRFGRSKGTQPPDITAKRFVEPAPVSMTGLTLVDNGMGKDGLLMANMAKEMGLDFRCVTVGNQFKNSKLWNERYETMKNFHTFLGVEWDVVHTNYMQKVAYKSIPWWMFSLPLVWKYGANRVVMGLHIGNGKHYIENNAFVDIHISLVGLRLLSRAVGVSFESWNYPLAEVGSAKVFWERYPESIPYQRSCMLGWPYCGRCVKCYTNLLYQEVMGKEPPIVGLKGTAPESFSESDFVDDQLGELLKRRRGEPYAPWVAGANETVLNLLPFRAQVACILSEHVPFYDEDPPADDQGRASEPSKWEAWIEQDYWQVIGPVREGVQKT